MVFRGTYDERNWDVLRERWDELRAQLHGVVISTRLTASTRSWWTRSMARPLTFRPNAGGAAQPGARANLDADDVVAYYLDEGTASVALDFIDALEQAYTHIGRHPGTGLPRYGQEVDIPGLRSWSLSRHPYVVFYVERLDLIDVWRVLHGQRDIPAWMQDPDTLA